MINRNKINYVVLKSATSFKKSRTKNLIHQVIRSFASPRMTARELKGFTAMELLLGLTIFALIAVSISSTLWAGIKLSRRVDPQNNISREIQLTLDLMAHELENALFYDFSHSYPDKFAFIGEPSRVSFILESDDGLKVIRYYLDQPESSRIHAVKLGNVHKKNADLSNQLTLGDSLHYLIREEIPFKEYLSGTLQNTQIEVINTHVKREGLTFFYEQNDRTQKDVQFLGTFQNNMDLPRRVRIKMDIFNKKRKDKNISFQRDVLIPTKIL